MKPKAICSVPCGQRYRGKRYVRCAVVVVMSSLYGHKEIVVRDIIAESPADAIELVRREHAEICAKNPDSIRPVEFHSWGVKGGHVFRYSGWETLIGEAIFRARNPDKQFEFNFNA